MRSLTRIVTAAAALAIIGGGALFWTSGQRTAAPLPGLSDLGLAPSAASAEEAGDAHEGYFELVLGAEDAPITFIEYGSFTCPHCATHHRNVFPRLVEEYIETGKMRYIFREVYFDRFGLWAAMVARCTGPERYEGMVSLLFERQAQWARGSDAEVFNSLRRLGRLAGMTDDEIDACAQDRDTQRMLVTLYQENTSRDGINSTPSFVINGQRFNNMAWDDLRAILDGKIDG